MDTVGTLFILANLLRSNYDSNAISRPSSQMTTLDALLEAELIAAGVGPSPLPATSSRSSSVLINNSSCSSHRHSGMNDVTSSRLSQSYPGPSLLDEAILRPTTPHGLGNHSQSSSQLLPHRVDATSPSSSSHNLHLRGSGKQMQIVENIDFLVWVTVHFMTK